MKKYSKKIALILALTLVLAMAVPAFAAQTNISGSYKTQGSQVINVVVSGGSSVKAYLNPNGYDADVYANNVDTNAKDNVAIGQLKPSGNITTMPIVGVNLGTNKVKVRAAVVSTLAGNFKFASSAPSEKTTSGLVFLEAKAFDNVKVNASYDVGYDASGDLWGNDGRYDAFDGEKLLNMLNGWKDNAWIDNDLLDKTKKTEFTKAFGLLKKTNKKENKTDTEFLDEIVVLKKGVVESKQQLCTLPAAAVEGDDVYPSIFLARLSGRLGKGVPGDLKKEWTANDGFGASIIWTFQTVSE